MGNEKKQWALSIRQPWAWLIVNGYKDVENRTWPTKFRGALWIHAGATMKKADYEACRIFVDGIKNIELPAFEDLERGGIVGAAYIVDCVQASQSPWFTGDYGFVFGARVPVPFRKCKGALGFWNVWK